MSIHRTADHNLTLKIIFTSNLLTGATWIGGAGESLVAFLILDPVAVLKGQVWRLVTYALVYLGEPIWFLIYCLFFHFIARPIEVVWGTRRFLTLLAISVLGASGTAMAFGQILADNWATLATLLLVHGLMFPESMMMLMFFIPMRVRTFAFIITAGMVLTWIRSMVLGEWIGLVHSVGMAAGMLYYLLRAHVISKILIARRRARFQGPRPSLTEQALKKTVMARAQEIMDQHVPGRPLAEKDRMFLESLIQASDPTHELCSPYSFSPENTICPPCNAFGRCLRRYLEAIDGEIAQGEG